MENKNVRAVVLASSNNEIETSYSDFYGGESY